MKIKIIILLVVSLALAEDVMDIKEATTVESDETTIETPTKVESQSASSTVVASTTTTKKPENGSEEDYDEIADSSESSLPSHLSSPKKRKILYVNQQQHGKLNVQLELSDVSLIVIPNSNDPQLSLIDLLLRSAQKSSAMNEAKKKDGLAKAGVNSKDDYSKYNYIHTSTNVPSIESRAPYKVDISSTLNSQPMLDMLHDDFRMTSSPMLKVKKPIVLQMTSPNRAKRSIESNLVDGENEVDETPVESSEEIVNAIEDVEEFSGEEVERTSEFVLLGATENCGPGRRRNSYQVCVTDA